MRKRRSLPIAELNTATRHRALGVTAVLALLVGAAVTPTAGAQPTPQTAAARGK